MPATPPSASIHVPFKALAIALMIFGVLLTMLGMATTLTRSARAEGPAPSGLYSIEAKRLDGRLETLDQYRGQVILIVNTASRCGNTPQYEALQKLYSERRDEGFVVLGFPSNDFGNQEPGTDRQIGDFCKMNYGVEFPMFSKVEVRGPDAHPVYAYLTAQPAPVGGRVEWNFQKYLVDREGRVVSRFAPGMRPNDPKIMRAVDALLEQSSPDVSGVSPRAKDRRAAAPTPILYADCDGTQKDESETPSDSSLSWLGWGPARRPILYAAIQPRRRDDPVETHAHELALAPSSLSPAGLRASAATPL